MKLFIILTTIIIGITYGFGEYINYKPNLENNIGKTPVYYDKCVKRVGYYDYNYQKWDRGIKCLKREKIIIEYK